MGQLKFHRYSQEKTLNWLKKKVPASSKNAKYFKEKRSGNAVSPCDKLWIISSRADLGGENCYCAEEEEHLCGRRSQIHDVRQSEDRIRPQRG